MTEITKGAEEIKRDLADCYHHAIKMLKTETGECVIMLHVEHIRSHSLILGLTNEDVANDLNEYGITDTRAGGWVFPRNENSGGAMTIEAYMGKTHHAPPADACM